MCDVQKEETGGVGTVTKKEPFLKDIDEPAEALKITVSIWFYLFLCVLSFLVGGTLSFVIELFLFPASPYEPCNGYTSMAQPPVFARGYAVKVMDSGHDPPLKGSVIDGVMESGHDPPVMSCSVTEIESGYDPPIVDNERSFLVDKVLERHDPMVNVLYICNDLDSGHDPPEMVFVMGNDLDSGHDTLEMVFELCKDIDSGHDPLVMVFGIYRNIDSGHDPPVHGLRYTCGGLEREHDPHILGPVWYDEIGSGHDPPVTSSVMYVMYEVYRANTTLIRYIFEVISVLYSIMSCLFTIMAFAWNVQLVLAVVLTIHIGRFLVLCYVLVIFLLCYNTSATEKCCNSGNSCKEERFQVSALKDI